MTCFKLLFLLVLLHNLSTCTGQAIRVRLVDGSSVRDGRVEITYRSENGTICDDGWTTQDAAVVCRMLGYTGPARNIFGRSGVYPPGPSSMRVLLRAVQCSGNEATLDDCPFQLNQGLCDHSQDAGVICLGDLMSTTTTTTPRPSTTTASPRICNTTSPNVRLMTINDTLGQAAGRVQVLHNGLWKAVCDNMWGVQDAQVVCRNLCYNPSNARAVLGGQQLFGNATEGFWFSDVQCNGTERNITDCPHSDWGNATNCDASEPAGVSCLADSPAAPPLPSPDMDCDKEMLTAKFWRANDPLLQQQHLSVSASNGQPFNCYFLRYNDSQYVSISIPYVGNCSTLRQENATHIIYSNTVRYAVPSPSDVITRTEVYYVHVYCVLPRIVDPDNGFDPQGRTAPPQSGTGNYNVKLMFFQDNQFQNPLSSSSGTPLRLVLGDWAYVGAQLYSTDTTMKLILAACYVSPSMQPDVSPQYYLIRDKCAVESTVTMYPINDTLSGFRFQSFRFVSNTSNYLYLHCQTWACAQSEMTGNCDPTCSPTGRRRRDAVGPDVYNVISGPFVIAAEPLDGDANHVTSFGPPTSPAVVTSPIKVNLQTDVEDLSPAMTSPSHVILCVVTVLLVLIMH